MKKLGHTAGNGCGIYTQRKTPISVENKQLDLQISPPTNWCDKIFGVIFIYSNIDDMPLNRGCMDLGSKRASQHTQKIEVTCILLSVVSM